MSTSHRSLPIAAGTVAAACGLALAPPAAAQSSVAVSPFVSYVPSAATNPLVGMSLTFGGTTGLALRASGDMSISTPANSAAEGVPSTGGYRPWAADADAMLYLGGLGGGATVFSRSLSPYVFTGLGMTGGDSAGVNVMNHGWSYGAGATIPLGFDADLFGEARWRMSRYVLPTAHDAPDSRSELRFGLSFHVGGSREPRRGRRYESYDDDVAAAQVVPVAPVIVAPAPAEPVYVEPVQTQPAPVVVVQPAPRPSTTVIVTRPSRSRTVVRPGRTVYRTRQPAARTRTRSVDRTRSTRPSRASRTRSAQPQQRGDRSRTAQPKQAGSGSTQKATSAARTHKRPSGLRKPD